VIASSPSYRLPQAKRSVRTGWKIPIEWDDGSSRRGGRGTFDEYNGRAILKNQILAVTCRASKHEREGRNAARFTEFVRRGRESNDRRSKMRQPNRRCSVRPLVWVEREISDPSG
jgi:hypothetical protein